MAKICGQVSIQIRTHTFLLPDAQWAQRSGVARFAAAGAGMPTLHARPRDRQEDQVASASCAFCMLFVLLCASLVLGSKRFTSDTALNFVRRRQWFFSSCSCKGFGNLCVEFEVGLVGYGLVGQGLIRVVPEALACSLKDLKRWSAWQGQELVGQMCAAAPKLEKEIGACTLARRQYIPAARM